MGGRVIVGVDGSDGSRRALKWAVEEAALRHSELEAVLVWQASDFERHHHPKGEDERAADARRRLGDALGGGLVEEVRVEIEPLVLEGDPADTLLGRANGADLLVVGSRGHSVAAGILLGSVSRTCAHHSRVPVVIVPRHPRAAARDKTRRIVVGIDGSAGSRQALSWALGEATLRGAHLEAVAVWLASEANDEMSVELAMFPSIGRRDRSLAEATKDRLEAALSELPPVPPQVEIDASVLEGRPAEVLCERAGEAELLVVGSRGHGAVAGVLLGSVSTACVHRSPRPVVIVPHLGAP